MGLDAYGPYRADAPSVQKGVVHRGCVIRLYDTGPEIHANSSHHAVGVLGVSLDSAGRVIVRSDVTSTEAVIACYVLPDESLTKAGVHVGLSGGAANSVLFFTDRDGKALRADQPPVAGTVNNVWVGFTHLNKDGLT